jgi:hypothetical protein
MTESPSWPRIGDPDQWTHLTVDLEHDVPGPAAPVATFEVWGRYPAVVVRESVDGNLVREVRANAGASASLDVGRSLCLAKTGMDPDEAYHAAIAIVAGPVAQLYGAASLEGWRRRTVRNGVAYYNGGPGALRQATIDPETGLPHEADSVDGRWRWVIKVAGDDPPSAAPDVTKWAKESHERRSLDTDTGPVEQLRYRSSTLPEPLEFISTDQGESPARIVIQRSLEEEFEHFRHPDGRPARILAGEREVAERLVAQVAERLGTDREAPGADEDVGQWDGRINALVGSITAQTD